jgi:hypothetical protein
MVDRSGRLGHWWRLCSLSCFFFPSCRCVTSSPRLCVAVEIPGVGGGRDFQRVWEGPGRRAGGGPELSMPGQIPQPGWGACRAGVGAGGAPRPGPSRRALRRRDERVVLAPRLAFELELVSVVDQAIEQGVGQRGVADRVVPGVDG